MGRFEPRVGLPVYLPRNREEAMASIARIVEGLEAGDERDAWEGIWGEFAAGRRRPYRVTALNLLRHIPYRRERGW